MRHRHLTRSEFNFSYFETQLGMAFKDRSMAKSEVILTCPASPKKCRSIPFSGTPAVHRAWILLISFVRGGCDVGRGINRRIVLRSNGRSLNHCHCWLDGANFWLF